MLDRPSSAVKKSVVMRVGALLAMMAILVLSNPAPNGIFAHPQDDGQTHDGVAADTDDHIHIHYDENGMGPVRDFDSKDPEGSGIEWNVRGVDAADFEISSDGVLTFIESPDYENPTDRGLNLNAADEGGSPDFGDEGEFAPIDHNYQIKVSATEVWDGDNASLPAKRTDMAITVIVGNEDDTGELTLQWLQPEVGTLITATLTDPDGETSEHTWTWYRSKVATVDDLPDVNDLSHWIQVADPVVTAQATSSYLPQGDTVADDSDVAIDEDDYLRVMVSYTDLHGINKTMNRISKNPVRAAVSFIDNASPDFPDVTDTRSVPESTAVGDPVGAPVTATDENKKDILTYELIASPDPNAGDVDFFDIDQASGQITVAQGLDYDSHQDRGPTNDRATAGEYTVIVRVTDPSGSKDEITVTITAENANEAPMVTGRAELSVVEGTIDITDEDAVLVYTSLPDAPTGTDPGPTNQENEYVYEDPDYFDSIARWTLEGDDKDAFEQSGRFEPRYLQFTVAPDFENPTDMNRDNVYEVTLVATDTDPLGTGAGIGKVKVWVTVTNVNEAGMVVFTEGEAFLNGMLVAEVQDPDDHGGDLGEPHEGVHIVKWQWSRAETDVVADAEFEDIEGETTNTYTPRDTDRGFYLRATARYTDPFRTEDDPSNMEDQRIAEGSLRTEMATTENAVRVAPDPGSVPTFAEAEDGPVTRSVAEDAAEGDDVGEPVKASGGVAYTLGGPDAEHFDIISDSGQIKVGADPSFDYDDPEISNTYRVTVKVTGGDANQKAEVEVVIMVTDVDEPPVITDADVDESPMIAVMYPEIKDKAPNTDAVATYVGTDPEEDSIISWDLRGADAALFTIAGGVLRFMSAPDYENPKDKVGANTATPDAVGIAPDGTGTSDNTYNVVIRAIASRDSDDTGPAETVDTLVAVTVTDVDEEGEVVISWLQPEVAIQIMASLTDPDGGVISVTWQWDVSEVAANVLDIDVDDHWGEAPGGTPTSENYTPDGANLDDGLDTNDDLIDEGKYLRVTATYTDTNGSEKTAHAMSDYPVQARGLGAKNQSPDFEVGKVDQSVEETAEVGANVGVAVRAPVGGSSGIDRLTYGLRAFVAETDAGSTGVTAPADAAADLAAFDINKATGQITVAQKLDFESRGPVGNRDGKYFVVATVTDPSGLYDTIVVVITASDVNEDPVLSGRPELTINEIDGGAADADSPLFVGNIAEADPTVNVYNVVDEDRRDATQKWDLEGEDAGEFQLIGEVGRTLVFRNQPDYENPADADGDNVYKVTVVTFDGVGSDAGRGEFDVCIAVLNIDEAGKITLLDEEGNEVVQPRAQGAITAELTDPDGGVTDADVMWVWSRSQNDPPTDGDPTPIVPAATSDTYTPTNADTGFFLSVTATYMDAKNDAPTDLPDPEADTTDRTAAVTSAHAVLEVEDKGQDPAFPEYPEDGIGADGTVTVEVAENSPSGTYVGEAILAAVDPDKGTTLIYTLGGDDAALFTLVNTRQIVVAEPLVRAGTGGDSDPPMDAIYDLADLDHEGDKKTYTVELKASDGNDDTDDATLTVTITVTNRNEAPSMPMVGSGEAPTPDANNAPEFPDTEDGMRSVAENTATGMPIGDPVAATDADAGDTLMYTLGGADMASFAIDDTTGQLMTMAALDYEAPADADTDNAYEVTVTASDGTAEAMVAVTITVTDMGLADSYDANEDEMIDSDEVLNAVEDYFNDVSGIDSERVLDIVELYFNS